MLTKEEILKKYETDRIESHEQLDFDDYIIVEKAETIHAALEEYAKQEALIFFDWVDVDTMCRIEGEITLDKLWNEYQKSKVK